MTLGQRLQRARRKAEVTQEDLAADLGVSRRQYIRWEQDECTPDTAYLVRIHAFLRRFDRALKLADVLAYAVPEPVHQGGK